MNFYERLIYIKIHCLFIISGPTWLGRYIFDIKGWSLENYHFDAIEILDSKSIFFPKKRDELSKRILEKIALTHHNHSLRREATNHIKCKEILVKIAFEDTSTFVREQAVKNIYDANILHKIILTDKAVEVRRSALYQINDQKILEQLLATNYNCEIRSICVNRVSNINTILDHLITEEDSEVIITILDRLNSEISFDNHFALKIPKTIVNRLLKEEMIDFHNIDFLRTLSKFLTLLQKSGRYLPSSTDKIMMWKIEFQLHELFLYKAKEDELRKMGLLRQRSGY